MRTTFMSDKVLNTYRATNITAPATIYCSLITAVSDAEAGTFTEASFAGYARVACAFGAPAAVNGLRTISNSGAVTHPAKTDAGSVAIIALGLHEALADGASTTRDIVYLDGADPISAIGNDVPTDFLRSPAHGLTTDQQVRFEIFPGETTLPAGLSENTTYWVRATGLTVDDFTVSTTQGGAAVNITAQGRALVHKITILTINQNDQANFAIGNIKVADD